MRFWMREVAGWVLIGISLFVFCECYRMFDGRRPLEGGAMAMVGIFIFRGGIHLLKVAVAAQVCLETAGPFTKHEQLGGQVPERAAKTGQANLVQADSRRLGNAVYRT
jgi:hypothetical protein